MEWNQQVGDEVRAALAADKVCMINIMGSPGAGKTSLITGLIGLLRGRWRIGVIEGDIAGTVDAERIAAVFDEWTSGTTGKSLNCEAMSVKSYIDGVKVQGRAYFNGKWSKFSNDGCSIGNIGVPITAFEFRLTGANANKYNISYRGHFSNIGWTKFFSNEYTCGNAKQSNRLEAFEIKITAK